MQLDRISLEILFSMAPDSEYKNYVTIAEDSGLFPEISKGLVRDYLVELEKLEYLESKMVKTKISNGSVEFKGFRIKKEKVGEIQKMYINFESDHYSKDGLRFRRKA